MKKPLFITHANNASVHKPQGIVPALVGALLCLAFLVGSPQVVADVAANALADARAAAAQQTESVNINTADVATLAEQLRGVGHSRAQEIVRHREAYGRFASLEELLEVKGIGKSTLDQNRRRITLD